MVFSRLKKLRLVKFCLNANFSLEIVPKTGFPQVLLHTSETCKNMVDEDFLTFLIKLLRFL